MVFTLSFPNGGGHALPNGCQSRSYPGCGRCSGPARWMHVCPGDHQFPIRPLEARLLTSWRVQMATSGSPNSTRAGSGGSASAESSTNFGFPPVVPGSGRSRRGRTGTSGLRKLPSPAMSAPARSADHASWRGHRISDAESPQLPPVHHRRLRREPVVHGSGDELHRQGHDGRNHDGVPACGELRVRWGSPPVQTEISGLPSSTATGLAA